jgi:hypothetical protein
LERNIGNYGFLSGAIVNGAAAEKIIRLQGGWCQAEAEQEEEHGLTPKGVEESFKASRVDTAAEV